MAQGRTSIYMYLVIGYLYITNAFIPKQHLESFLEFVQVPTEVYLGLLSKSAVIQNTTLVKGYCLNYDVLEDARCKFYSDCCAMIPARPMEQLPQGTFSCHNGYYVVDKCPATTVDKELKRLCETEDLSLTDISLSRWPVRGTVNHLLYKNIYCAMCNGIDPYAKVNLSTQHFYNQTQADFDHKEILDIIEWLPATVQCVTEEIGQYVENQPTRAKLLNLIKKHCDTTYNPPTSPDLCWDAVRICPENSHHEVSMLCSKGPVNYIKAVSNNKFYRNQFCAMCHNVDVTNTKPIKLDLNSLQPKTLGLWWRNNKLFQSPETKPSTHDVLMVGRPSLYSPSISLEDGLKTGDFKSRINISCSYFAVKSHDFCKQNEGDIVGNVSSTKAPIWNLGSFNCYSPHARVCDEFLIRNQDANSDCTSPGCSGRYLLEPQTLSCITADNFNIIPNTVMNNLTWHSDIICQYRSRCESIILGLIKENEINCYCDEACIYYNDCCADSKYQATEETILDHNTFSCVTTEDSNIVGGFNMGLMEIDQCPENYSNVTTINQCNLKSLNHEDREWSSQQIPVTDTNTGLRYANMHCAECHGVKEFMFWRVEIGCIEVANDRCTQPIWRDPTSTEFQDVVKTLHINPDLEQLKNYTPEWCSIKRIIPPKHFEHHRQCRLDALEYVSTCPEETKDWKLSELCESEPTSFIYEGNSLDRIGKAIGNIGTKFFSWDSQTYKINYKTFIARRKFRNSYCASCNSVAWQGCHMKATFSANDNDTKLFNQYMKGATKYMFIFTIDFNQRMCSRDSDAYLVYPNLQTGQDTCLQVTNLLRKCDCGFILDLNTTNCLKVELDRSFITCNYSVINSTDSKIPEYATAHCPTKFTYNVLQPQYSQNECDKCLTTWRDSVNNSACKEVFTFDIFLTNTFEILPSIHCQSPKLLHCKHVTPNDREQCINAYMLLVSFHGLYATPVESEYVLLNAISITYAPSIYLFKLEPTTLHGGFDLVFSTFIEETSSYCSKFETNNNISSGFLICKDQNIRSIASPNLNYKDYLLEGNDIKVCTRYDLPGFDLQIQDYILCALSIVAIIIYVVYYAIKKQWSLTGNLVVSALITLAAALLFYSLTKTLRSSILACRIVGSLAQYFLMCTHTWTNAIAIWMMLGIIRIQVAATSSTKKYVKFALYAWLTPTVFIALTYILDKAQVNGLYPVFTPYLCFITGGWVRFLLFTGPIYAFVLANLIMCAIATYKIIRSGTHMNVADKRRNKKKLLTVAKLQIIFGFHWFLIYFTEISSPHKKVLWIIISISISLQGVAVVLSQLIQLDTFSRISNLFTDKSTNRSLQTNEGGSNLTKNTQSSQL